MIDTFMVVWKRYHGAHGIKLFFIWLLIGISLLSLLATVGMASQGSLLHHAKHITNWHNSKSRVTATKIVGSERGAVTTTPGNARGHRAYPSVIKPARKKGVTPTSQASAVSGGHIHTPVQVPASPTPSPMPDSLPTITPTGTEEPVPTPTEDMPLPEPTDDDEDTPIWNPTDIIFLPPEKTVTVLITPSVTVVATSTSTSMPVVSPTGGDEDDPPVQPGCNPEEARHVGYLRRQNAGVKTSESVPNCLSDSVDMAMDKENDGGDGGGLLFNAAIIVWSVLPVALLFYGLVCAMYVRKRKRESR